MSSRGSAIVIPVAILVGAAHLIGFALKGIGKATIFIVEQIYKRIQERKEKIEGLSSQAQQMYQNAVTEFNDAQRQMKEDAQKTAEDIKMANQKLETALDTGVQQSERELMHFLKQQTEAIRTHVDKSMSALDKTMDSAVNQCESFYHDFSHFVADALEDIRRLSLDEQAKLQRQKALAQAVLNDAQLLLKEVKTHESAKFINPGQFLVIDNAISGAVAQMSNGIYEASIISLDSTTKQIMDLMAQSERDMQKEAMRAAHYQSYIESARAYLQKNSEMEYQKDGKVFSAKLNQYLPREYRELFQKLDAMSALLEDKAHIFSDDDLLKAFGVYQDAVQTTLRASEMCNNFHQRSHIAAALKKGMADYRFDCLGRIVEPVDGKPICIRFHNEDNHHDLEIDLLENECDGVPGIQMQYRVYINGNAIPGEEEMLVERYKQYVLEVLQRYHMASEDGFSCSGEVQGKAENWNTMVLDNRRKVEQMKVSQRELFEQQRGVSEQNGVVI